jgi:hypothetical protein
MGMKLPEKDYSCTWPIGKHPRATLRARIDAAIKDFASIAGLHCTWTNLTTLTVRGTGLSTGLSGTVTIGPQSIVLRLRLPISLWGLERDIDRGIRDALARELPVSG